jgi:hypothetical protein
VSAATPPVSDLLTHRPRRWSNSRIGSRRQRLCDHLRGRRLQRWTQPVVRCATTGYGCATPPASEGNARGVRTPRQERDEIRSRGHKEPTDGDDVNESVVAMFGFAELGQIFLIVLRNGLAQGCRGGLLVLPSAFQSALHLQWMRFGRCSLFGRGSRVFLRSAQGANPDSTGGATPVRPIPIAER